MTKARDREEARRTKVDGDMDRSPRSDDTREASIAEETWSPPAMLPDPHPRPGIVHRWVRNAILGDADQQNVSMRMREGWTPCRPEDYPEMETLVGVKVGNNDVIEVGGLMLCHASEAKMAARDRYHAEKSEAQIEGVESALMSNSDPRMPIQRPQTRTKTVFGAG